MCFAAAAGIDQKAPENQDVATLVEQVLKQFKSYNASGETWKGLNVAVMAAWTHDPHNGWLANMHRG